MSVIVSKERAEQKSNNAKGKTPKQSKEKKAE